MTIISEEVSVNARIEDVFAFVKDAQNYWHLMPQDKISNWAATEEECSFTVQGGFIIPLVRNGEKEFSNVYLKSGEKAPFAFTLDIQLVENGDETSGKILFSGELNMFLKMMVEKPMTALFNTMCRNLKKYYETVS